jgi:SAM-dependent methyltransferase
MPDAAVLVEMYGSQYARSFVADATIDDAKEMPRVVAWLRKEGEGRFIDFGCGDGSLLREAAALGWDTLGVEFADDVAAAVAARTSVRVVGRTAAAAEPPADVVHVGDVIEHLTELDCQMPEIVRLVKPGGILLAQGPLEAQANLFTWILRLARRFRATPSTMPPYHVILATAAGQRRLFERHRLDAIQFRMHEVSWPAPARLGVRDVMRPRAAGLFTLRKVSQAVSRVANGRWGNRYFYAGRRHA